MWKALDAEIVGESGQNPIQFIGCKREVEIEADERIDVRTDRLAGNHAAGCVQFGRSMDETIDRAGFVRRSDAPEGACTHIGLMLLP